MKPLNNIRLIVLLCLTLGLAPFFPEPHLWGKIKWVIGGAKDMQLMDWFDILLHGLPWILLIRVIILNITQKNVA
ncbi:MULTISPECIES: hypothetical protein [Mesoflavibacter]|uniref:RND transporter n=1 Tax=Mesoflavibacter profundi TaxID=2708110 RepID=A0ABT4S009_9FLAO|nr:MULTISPECIES: hypothetical protein [Mesoflavibacter]MDA0177223.1 hypothetical protein [Mesoflavibacter profundi]QIJ88143.1 hypothetical protein C7H62_0333 [Mesoflavibacter sp. HG96]QIJ90871.1 hypothetical protein C7H56_0333 [Mesoflavibacter sp. HG37]